MLGLGVAIVVAIVANIVTKIAEIVVKIVIRRRKRAESLSEQENSTLESDRNHQSVCDDEE